MNQGWSGLPALVPATNQTGTYMRLRQEDRKAVDLLLDRAPVAARGNGYGNGQAVYAGADGAIRERVAKVETLFHILDSWPVSEPPRDLIEQTLELIEDPAARQHRNLHIPSVSPHHRPA